MVVVTGVTPLPPDESPPDPPPQALGVPRVVFLETGLRFEADVVRGQKTGFFLDQRENRRRVEALAAGRDVLNAFSFSGGFSLYAARGDLQLMQRRLKLVGGAVMASDEEIARNPRARSAVLRVAERVAA